MGQEQCRAMPKGDLNHAETRSKIGHRRVRKRGRLVFLFFRLPLAEVGQSVAVWQSCLWSAIIAIAIFCL